MRVVRQGAGPMAQDTKAFRALALQLKLAGLGPMFELEYCFATSMGRKWKWDIAFVDHKLAVEVDGGIWVQGAHGHPTTILRNMEKRNWAVRLGWRVLAFDTKQAQNGEALAFIDAVLMKVISLTPQEELIRAKQQLSKARRRRRHAP